MKAILVSAFLSYEPRLFMVKDALDALGVKTQVLLTDFDHRRKALREDRGDFAFKHDDITFIPTRPYRKNLSLARLLSHVDFARKAKRIIEKDVPDILYCLIAPNSVGFLASCIKKKHPQMKLIVDVCDMWPEAFPAKCANRLFAVPFLFWRLLRTCALKRADCVLTECDRFSRALTNYEAKTVFWSLKKVSDPQAFEERLCGSAIHLAYLGSINHILDIERTASLTRELAKKKPVTVHVIGMGEKKTEFLKALRESGATVIDYGAVFEERRLGEIFSQCYAGLNVMKKEVNVSLSMKTLAYFKLGVSLINPCARFSEVACMI